MSERSEERPGPDPETVRKQMKERDGEIAEEAEEELDQQDPESVPAANE